MISISPSDPLPPDAAVTEIRHFLRHFSRVAALFFFFWNAFQVATGDGGMQRNRGRTETGGHVHDTHSRFCCSVVVEQSNNKKKKKENRLQKKKRVRYIDEIVDISRKYLKVGPKIESWSRQNP